jgi:hypothetical protein
MPAELLFPRSDSLKFSPEVSATVSPAVTTRARGPSGLFTRLPWAARPEPRTTGAPEPLPTHPLSALACQRDAGTAFHTVPLLLGRRRTTQWRGAHEEAGHGLIQAAARRIPRVSCEPSYCSVRTRCAKRPG